MKIAIVGMGLIGASLGRAIVKYTDNEVYGYDSDKETLRRADELAAHTKRLEDADRGSVDIVIFALCPDVAIEMMNKICPYLKDGAIVADTCGNKRVIADEMKRLQEHFPSLCFVGTHPMAGREYSGIEYSSADLFRGAYFIVTPVTQDEIKLKEVEKLFMAIGAAGVEYCSAQRHDEMIAYTSQLAHVASSCYVQNPLSALHAGFSAGSFADLTRVARLNPEMWTQLFLQNKDNLVKSIEDLYCRLGMFKDAIACGDAQRIRDMLAEGVKCKNIADEAAKEKSK